MYALHTKMAMLTFLLGGCGTGKSTRLMEKIRTDLTNKRKVMLLVPEQFSFDAEKRLYDFLGPILFNQVETFSFATLSRRILETYAQVAGEENYASEQEKLLILRHAIRQAREQGELSILRQRSQASDFVPNMLSLITKIRKAGVQAQQLLDATLAFDDRLQDKVHDTAMILTFYDRLLAEHGLHDGLTDLTEAALLANMQNYFRHYRIYIDEFDSFTGDQYSMLEVMLAQADDVTTAIRTDEPQAAVSVIFEGGNMTYRRLKQIAADTLSIPVTEETLSEYVRSAHCDLNAVSTQILLRSRGTYEYQDHIRILEAPDPAAEAEYIAAQACELLHNNPDLHCSDIAVAVKSPDTYNTLLERAFTRCHLPCEISSASPVMHTELMRCVLSLLSLLAEETPDTEQMLRYMKIPFSGYQSVAVSMLEHFCFTWNIEQSDWTQPFWSEDPVVQERAMHFGGERLEETRSRILDEINELRKKCTGQSIRKTLSLLYAHLSEKKKHISFNDELALRSFTALWNTFCDMLDTLVSCFGDETTDFAELRDMLALMISTTTLSSPPQTLDSIRIVDAQMARLNDPEVVFVPGVSDGVFPGDIQIGGMFSRQELELLEAQGIAISRMFFELYSDERLIAVKILSAPKTQLCLTYPRMDDAGSTAIPSPVVLQLRQIFPETDNLNLQAESIPLSFYVRSYESAYYHFVRRLGSQDTPDLAALRTVLERHPVYAAKLSKLLTPAASVCDQVQPSSMDKLLGDTLIFSPTGIESFYHCPYQYFFQFCLGLYVPEKNEFSHRNVGNFAHYCFEQLLRHYGKDAFLQLSPAKLQDELQRLSNEFTARYISEAVQRDGRFRLNYRMSGRSLLDILLHMQREMQNGQFTPIGFEVKLSPRDEEGTLPCLSLRDGAILCKGKIDRVDLCNTPEGTLLRVIDYKTGAKDFAPEKLLHGLDMQMLIYLFALSRNRSYADASPSGVLYLPSGQMRSGNYVDRDKAKKDGEAILNEFYCMKGLVVDSAAPHMEPEIGSGCVPVLSSNTNSTLFSVTEEQMELIESHVCQKITDMADKLHQGDISPGSTPDTPCDFCSCKALCPPDHRVCNIKMDKTARAKAIKTILHIDDGKEEEA